MLVEVCGDFPNDYDRGRNLSPPPYGDSIVVGYFPLFSGKYVFDGHSACLLTKLQNESKRWVFAYSFLIFPIRKFLKV